MIGYWISFALIALLIPIGLASIKIWGEKHFKFTEEQKKNASINLFKYWIFFRLLDLFYMAFFLDNLICKFVFGCLIMVIILLSVCSSFVSSNRKTVFQKFCLLLDFIVGIGMTVYLIYLIPEKELQTIILTIVAALYGGLITLVGVAWTVKKSDKDRKEEEINRAKPCFSFNPYPRDGIIKGIDKFCFSSLEGETRYKREVKVQLENSNKSPFILKKIFHDDKWFDLEGNTTILPSGKCLLSFAFNSPSNIFLSIEDMIGNKYSYALNVLPMSRFAEATALKASNRTLHTVTEIKESQQMEDKGDGK